MRRFRFRDCFRFWGCLLRMLRVRMFAKPRFGRGVRASLGDVKLQLLVVWGIGGICATSRAQVRSPENETGFYTSTQPHPSSNMFSFEFRYP